MQDLLAHSPFALLLLQIGVILVVARIFGVAFRYIGQPLVVAEIFAGLALGPSGLGLLSPDTMQLLFPKEGLPELYGVSQLGLVLFMFIVGLEFDHSLLRNRGSLAVRLSPYTIAVPFALGMGLAWVTYERLSPPEVPLSAYVLFSGAALAVTAFPVLARILSESGLSRTTTGTLTLTCAAVNDVVAWCLLAFIVVITRTGGVAESLMTTGLAVLYVAVMLTVVKGFLARLANRYGSSLRNFSQGALFVVLLLLIVSALVAELIGIHALFGSFLFGAVVPREKRLVQAMLQRMEDLVVVLLLPLFFAFTGLRTEFGLLDDPRMWGWAFLITAVATVGKILGSTPIAMLNGLSWRDSLTIGVLMNTRGLMELVLLNVGLDLGVITPAVFTMMVFMAVATTFLTTPLVRLLNPRRVQLETTPSQHATPPGGEVVLTCVSLPESIPGLAQLTAALARASDVRAYALRLIPIEERASLFPDTDPVSEEEDTAVALARHARTAGVVVQPITFPSNAPSRDISEVARIKKANVVLLGMHRSLVGTAPLGGPLPEIASHLSCDVGMFQDRGLKQVRRVLVVPGGEHDAALQRMVDRLRGPDVHISSLSAPRSLERLIKEAEGYDLVVVGVGEEWGLVMQNFGIQRPRILVELPCSLLVVHGLETPESAD